MSTEMKDRVVQQFRIRFVDETPNTNRVTRGASDNDQSAQAPSDVIYAIRKDVVRNISGTYS
jgi:hypothetical protein